MVSSVHKYNIRDVLGCVVAVSVLCLFSVLMGIVEVEVAVQYLTAFGILISRQPIVNPSHGNVHPGSIIPGRQSRPDFAGQYLCTVRSNTSCMDRWSRTAIGSFVGVSGCSAPAAKTATCGESRHTLNSRQLSKIQYRQQFSPAD